MIKFLLSFTILLCCTLSAYAQQYESYKKQIDTNLISKYLGFEKKLTITVPYEWQTDIDQEFPVILIFDRQNQRSHNYILNTIDYLTSNEQMPSSILVSVESDYAHRGLETSFLASKPNALGEKNEQFIFEELLLLLERDFKASTFRLFIGHSRYGYFTTSLLHSRFSEVNAVISLSPFFTQTNVDLKDSIALIRHKTSEFHKYYRFGIGNDYPDDYRSMKTVIDTIKNSKISLKGTLFKEASHNVSPGLTIANALYEVFEKWSALQNQFFANDQKEVSIYADLQEKITTHYGNQFPFAIGILNGKGWFFFNNKEYEKAIESWQLLIDNYPTFSEAHLNVLLAKTKLNLNLSLSIEQFEKSLAKSQFYTEEEKLVLMKELAVYKAD